MKPALLVSAVLSALLLTQCAVPAGGGGGPLPPATKEQPFVNSLGMKFVPVPGTNILMCTTETTVAQYQAAGMGYQAPKFPQSSNHPAVNVSWNDAKAWCAWLSKKEGRTYRLPKDAEWNSAVGGSVYPWGDSWPPPSNCGNYSGQELRSSTSEEQHMVLFNGWTLISGFSDRHKFTAPVGSYAANKHGLHDLGGNVWEWCEEWHPNYRGKYRELRGGSWYNVDRRSLSSSFLVNGAPDMRFNLIGYGFRCVVAR